ncbi:tRNA threonylcarbamoyladenosine dehydratase [bacterium]|nr:tRNA threonylcarbamoyladenosine dehydratase [bacterium]
MITQSHTPQPMTPEQLENYKLHRRFDRMGRLIGDAQMKRLMDSHVMIVGLGGVGSWAAESVVRSGVGKVTLVDFDEICVTNANRQLHALAGEVGKNKADVMAARMRAINPRVEAIPIALFYNEEHHAQVFQTRPDFVIDSIDHVTTKCQLLKYCRDEKIPVVCSTGSGGRLDPTQVKVTDLSQTNVDPLARELRRVLRQKYGFPSEDDVLFGIQAVYSTEPATRPQELHYDGGKGFRCVCPNGDNPYFNCDNRNIIMGNASFVTGTFGFVCASIAVRSILESANSKMPA